MTGHGTDVPPPGSHDISDRVWTVPNVLCFMRLGGAFVLLFIAWGGYNELFLWLFLFLAMTDWFDGKLAILLNQRTIIGARLDSWADASLFASLLFGLLTMYRDILLQELPLLTLTVGSYVFSTAAGFWKYGRWPSYHTRAAKTSWLISTLAVIALFLDYAIWPLSAALIAISLTNIEAISITIVSPRWRANVPSIYHALKLNREESN